MSKSEVQSLVSDLLGRRQIVILLLIVHGIPLGNLGFVPPHIVALDGDNEHNIPCANADEHFVSAVVIWPVVITVDLNLRLAVNFEMK